MKQSCEHIRYYFKRLGKKTKANCILTEYTCKDCGHKWKELQETPPPRNTAWLL